MSNVVYLHGAMHPRHYVATKVSEADLDAQIAANRERQDDAFDRMEQQLAHRRALSWPSVIPLDNSLRARLIRWARSVLPQLRSQP